MSLKYLARTCETVIFIRAPLPRQPHPAAGTSENRQAPLRCILCSHGASVKQRAVREARVAEATWYFDLLLAGAADRLARAFGGEAVVDDPRAGRIQGRVALESFIADTAEWLAAHRARGEPIGVVQAERRAV